VDSTLYQCQSVKPKLVLQEVCASECVQVSHFLSYFLRFLIESDIGRWYIC
jgi:hypothetical protein